MGEAVEKAVLGGAGVWYYVFSVNLRLNAGLLRGWGEFVGW
jgi:hypothetical protein